MKHYELSALRRLFFLSTPEAAKLIGGVSPRRWQYWEGGRNVIPEDVKKGIYSLVSQLQQCIENEEYSQSNEKGDLEERLKQAAYSHHLMQSILNDKGPN